MVHAKLLVVLVVVLFTVANYAGDRRFFFNFRCQRACGAQIFDYFYGGYLLGGRPDSSLVDYRPALDAYGPRTVFWRKRETSSVEPDFIGPVMGAYDGTTLYGIDKDNSGFFSVVAIDMDEKEASGPFAGEPKTEILWECREPNHTRSDCQQMAFSIFDSSIAFDHENRYLYWTGQPYRYPRNGFYRFNVDTREQPEFLDWTPYTTTKQRGQMRVFEGFLYDVVTVDAITANIGIWRYNITDGSRTHWMKPWDYDFRSPIEPYGLAFDYVTRMVYFTIAEVNKYTAARIIKKSIDQTTIEPYEELDVGPMHQRIYSIELNPGKELYMLSEEPNRVRAAVPIGLTKMICRFILDEMYPPMANCDLLGLSPIQGLRYIAIKPGDKIHIPAYPSVSIPNAAEFNFDDGKGRPIWGKWEIGFSGSVWTTTDFDRDERVEYFEKPYGGRNQVAGVHVDIENRKIYYQSYYKWALREIDMRTSEVSDIWICPYPEYLTPPLCDRIIENCEDDECSFTYDKDTQTFFWVNDNFRHLFYERVSTDPSRRDIPVEYEWGTSVGSLLGAMSVYDGYVYIPMKTNGIQRKKISDIKSGSTDYEVFADPSNWDVSLNSLYISPIANKMYIGATESIFTHPIASTISESTATKIEFQRESRWGANWQVQAVVPTDDNRIYFTVDYSNNVYLGLMPAEGPYAPLGVDEVWSDHRKTTGSMEKYLFYYPPSSPSPIGSQPSSMTSPIGSQTPSDSSTPSASTDPSDPSGTSAPVDTSSGYSTSTSVTISIILILAFLTVKF